jgi:aryl-alcohol dehydrogenase-like predicted oxidoreductase
LGAEALQVVYNRLDRRAEQLYFPQARHDNLGILARVPLACGLLSGKYAPGVTFPADDRRSALEVERMRADLLEVERLRQVEVPPGVPMAQWALAWCLKNPAVSAVIPGCKDPAQVASNAAAAELVKG